MPVSPTYPGVYIQELPSSAHTITAAPTSIAVFIGYVHPYRGNCATNETWGQAVQIFSFTEYEREFGGLFRSSDIDCALPYAVQQFFLNGGSVAYVVGLQPKRSGFAYPKPTVTIDSAVFTGLEPLAPELGFEMKVSIDNLQDEGKTADITVTYGSRAETFRGVSLVPTLVNGVPTNPKFIENRINGVSTLISVKSSVDADQHSYNTFATKAPQKLEGSGGSTVFDTNQFTAAFAEDGSLDKVDVFNLMVIPGVSHPGILAQALAFCERKRAFLIMDPPINYSADGYPVPGGKTLPKIEDAFDKLPKSANGAIYFPYLATVDSLTGKPTTLAPSGYVAGIYARTDNNRGVWKAPAGLETTLNNTTGVVPRGKLTDGRAGKLNDKGINAIRTFPDVGTVVFGARTLVSTNTAFQQWKYVPVRRTALFIEQTLLANLGWVVFEPNDTPLWVAITRSVERFMLSLFRQGAFQGSTPSEAFLVKCDSSTTTQDDIDNGIVNILVGFRPLKPAEFVIIQIAQLAGQVQA